MTSVMFPPRMGFSPLPSNLRDPLRGRATLWSLLRSLHPAGGYPSRLHSLALPPRSA